MDVSGNGFMGISRKYLGVCFKESGISMDLFGKNYKKFVMD